MKRRQERNVVPIVVAAVFIALVLVVCVLANQIVKNTPSEEKADLYEYFGFTGDLSEKTSLSMTKEDEVAIVLGDTRQEERGLLIDGRLYLPEQFVKEKLNARFYWDEHENLLLYTTPMEVISASVGSTDYTIGKNRQSAEYPIVRAEGSSVFIAADFVKLYTKLDYQLENKPNRVRLTAQWGEKKMVKPAEDTQVRVKSDIKSNILSEIKQGDSLYVIKEIAKDKKKGIKEDWIQVSTKDGIQGFVRKKDMEPVKQEKEDIEFTEQEYTSISREETINLVWHQVTNSAGNKQLSNVIANMKGVNVISPTWIKLSDNAGNIESLASADYVNLAHRCNMEVWALVDNFKSEVSTKELLSYTSRRENLINQLVAEVLKYNIDGINIDFEMVSEEAGEDYVQFIRELSIKCRINGIVLSIDNYNCIPEGGTQYYDRAAQGEVADYVINMGYDEHTNAGGISGSVASIDYVRRGIEGTLQAVPANKVINAIPFYSRLWKETPKTEEELAAEDISEEYIPYNLTSEALGMDTMDARLAASGAEKTWNEEAGQYYFEYEKDGCMYRAWMEEERSIEEKLKLMKEYKLAGVAAWKLGFERDSIWDTILKYTN